RRAERRHRAERHAQVARRRVPPQARCTAAGAGGRRRRTGLRDVRYRVVAVGKLKRGFFLDGCARYEKLLSSLSQVEVVEVRDHSAAGPAEARRRHAEASLAAADGHVVLLDEAGTAHTTASLASFVSALEGLGV